MPVLRPRALLLAAFLYAALVTSPATAAKASDGDSFLHPYPVQGTGSSPAGLFGYAVSLDGDTALVAAPFHTVGENENQGTVYVFVRSGPDWLQQQQLLAPEPTANHYFGYAVALSGDTALVAAPNEDVDGNLDQGAVYVFGRAGETWSFQQRLLAPDGAADDQFGYAVSLDGDTALIGAPYAVVDEHPSQGAVYVFTRDGGSWSFEQKLIAAEGGAERYFGYAVALDGATALVGAPFDPVGDHLDQGAAYVFMRDGGGWSQAQRLFAAEGAADDNLGWSVALSGDTALAGAPFTTLDGHTYQGAAYTFVRSAGSWSQDQQLFDPAGAADDNLGWSVALDGNTALAGAPFAGDQDHAKQGAAHVFVRGDGGWSRQQLAVPDAAADDQFGNAVALDTDTALVGAPYRDVDGDANRGTGYFFTPGSLDQSISFAPLPDRVLGEPSFPITATATSGLPVSFTALTPAVCTVQAGTVELHSAGVCTIRADQSGDASYHPAPPVEQSFTVAAPEPEPEPEPEPDSTPALFLPALTR